MTISVLRFFSNILERLIYNHLAEFLDINNILVENQYGFREKHSTFMASLKLVDDISEKLNKIIIQSVCSQTFPKLSLGLTTTCFLKKLVCYGTRGVAISWFVSYLQNRTQYVNINGADSNLLTIKCGVPYQGHCFLVHTYDKLFQVSKLYYVCRWHQLIL